ncbi:hypothetical protein [Streptomyces kanasensis]|uniref:hypothetical protein n=1 Tax=Streptomyces kanasensis TaxID=936756 RepID=UPI00382B85B6
MEAHASSDGCPRVVGCEALDPRDAVCAGHSAGAVSDVRASGVAAERAGAITDFPARLP